MGKNLQNKESGLILENSSPGCIWGIFHHINHQRWPHARKRLPQKRPKGEQHAMGVDDSVNDTATPQASEMKETTNPVMESRTVETKSPRPAHKSSMKSRIRALINEEVLRRKGRHRRSSSCPTRVPLERTNSIHHLEPNDLGLPADISLTNETLGCEDKTDPPHVSSLLDSPLPNVSDKSVTDSSSNECVARMLPVNHLKQSEADIPEKQSICDHTLLEDKMVYAIEPSRQASLQESKLFLEALDLLNVRKELFLKILHDPNSMLARQLHDQQASNSMKGLTKSMSFPTAGSPFKGTAKENDTIIQQKVESCKRVEEKPQEPKDSTICTSIGHSDKCSTTSMGECKEDDVPEQSTRIEPLDNAPPKVPNVQRKRHQKKYVVKRFKNLGEKIKHAIWEGKKEKQRIVMDGLLHKVPQDQMASNDVMEENLMHQELTPNKFHKCNSGSGSDNERVGSDFGKSEPRQIKRMSSFNESAEKYSRLLETSTTKETKCQISEKLRLRETETLSPLRSSKIALSRILSLPNLRSSSYVQNEDSRTVSSIDVPKREQRLPILSSEIKSHLESGSHENSLDVSATCDESANLKTPDSVISHDQQADTSPILEDSSTYQGNDGAEVTSASEEPHLEVMPEHLSPAGEDSLAVQQDTPVMDSNTSLENAVSTNAVENQAKKSYSDLLRVRVDAKNIFEFNYVRDVLELSGYSRNEVLGNWHSAEHPLDPSMFYEMEGCLLSQPDCLGNQERSNCDHLILFDLVNEVLLEIYQRSFSYWPKLLTCQSRLHEMPIGQHVLEEVWAEISWYLNSKPEIDQSLDDAVSRDLAKSDGWMNLQFDSECVGLELEELIFDDLLEELKLDLS